MTVIGHGYDDNVGAPLGRNLLINGSMQVAQRSTSTNMDAGLTVKTADRWAQYTDLGAETISVENDSPTGSGLRKSLKCLVTTSGSPAAGSSIIIRQTLEGQDCQRIAKGTSLAKQLTLSFWVKSNVTGTYIAELIDADNSRNVSKSYTINASGVWEQKILVFPADTTGVLDNDNMGSLSTSFWLSSGSTYTSGTLSTSWTSPTNANRAVGQVNLASSVNNYWQITGVQLEAGSVATPFEFEPFETTLRKCQRYYEKSFGVNTVPATAIATDRTVCTATTVGSSSYSSSVMYKVPKRTNTLPTLYNYAVNANNARWFTSAVTATDGGSVEAYTEYGFHLIISATNQTLAVFNWTVSAEL